MKNIIKMKFDWREITLGLGIVICLVMLVMSMFDDLGEKAEKEVSKPNYYIGYVTNKYITHTEYGTIVYSINIKNLMNAHTTYKVSPTIFYNVEENQKVRFEIGTFTNKELINIRACKEVE